MRTLAIGDIHGCFNALVTLFDYTGITATDRVIFLGDYVDRGPDSAKVIDFLINRLNQGNAVCLRGNHELMMESARHSLPARRSWAMTGGDTTLASYALQYKGKGLEAVPDSHWMFLSKLSSHFETEKHLFVHASLDSEVDLEDQFEVVMYSGNFDSIGPHRSGKTVICGHSSQKSGLPKSIGHAICIDTWACGNGWLTCLDVDVQRYWQANQDGETRTGLIDDLADTRTQI
jgi:serine/threonine protein phosphatase 1